MKLPTGHPDSPTAISDTIDRAPTPNSRQIEDALSESSSQHTNLEAEINALRAARTGGAIPPEANSKDRRQNRAKLEQRDAKQDKEHMKAMRAFRAGRRAQKELRHDPIAAQTSYHPEKLLKEPPTANELTLEMLLANQTHLGHATALWHPGNSSYIFGIRDGIHIISLDLTLSYLRRASKIVQEVARRGGIILFVGTRKNQEKIVVNSAKLAQPAYHIFSRWVPGSLTNGQQIYQRCALKVVDIHDQEIQDYRAPLKESDHSVLRPDLVICLNPIENEVCLHECRSHNVPTIGIVDTDCNPAWVTYPIPANDDSLRSVALIAGVLARAGQAGQEARLREASRGVATYTTRRVEKFFEGMEEIKNTVVVTRETGDEGRARKRE